MKHIALIRTAPLTSPWSFCGAFQISSGLLTRIAAPRPPQPLGLFQFNEFQKYQHQRYQLRLVSSDENTAETFSTIDDTAVVGSINEDVPNLSDQTRCNRTATNGTSDGLVITKMYRAPLDGFNIDRHVSDPQQDNCSNIVQLFTSNDLQRLEITPTNVTLPLALMLLDPMTYPTQSRARKAIRKKTICFSRYTDVSSCSSIEDTNNQFRLGKVLARIYPGDIIGVQRRAGSDYYASQGEVYRPPPFDIPVIYEDDHMAIINKPAGIVLYRAQGGRGGGTKNRGHGRDTLLSALPHVLKPSNIISDERLIEEGHIPLKRPHPVHRLDRPTSGLVVVAKTKYAAVHLAKQFEFRQATKSYIAIVNGYPTMPNGHAVTKPSHNEWNTIDYDLEDKSAVTKWRVIESVESLIGNDGVLSLVEMRPKTGRYHQLRRHFVRTVVVVIFDTMILTQLLTGTCVFFQAWVCNTPLVGDSKYDNGDTNALRLRQRGLFLCSNGIKIQHPYYNSPFGRGEWDNSLESDVLYKDKESGHIVVNVSIDTPSKFNSFLYHEKKRAAKFL